MIMRMAGRSCARIAACRSPPYGRPPLASDDAYAAAGDFLVGVDGCTAAAKAAAVSSGDGAAALVLSLPPPVPPPRPCAYKDRYSRDCRGH